MKRRFVYLVGVTLLAVLALVWLTPGERSSGEIERKALFLPSIAEQVNEVDRVEIVSAGNQTIATLLKSGGRWQLEQMHGYHANWSELQTLLADLAQARIVEQKTDKPEYYALLGVDDIAGKDAGSVLVKVSVGDQTTGILVGNQAQGGAGQYVRLQDESASALLDRQLEVSTRLLDWADSRIIDINSAEVAEVEIIHPEGDRIFVTRISADQTDFDLVGLPQGRELKSSWAVNSLASVFSMLDMETVAPVDNVDWKDAVRMRLLTFSGVEIMSDVVAVGDDYLLRLQASHPMAAVVNKQTGENQDAVDAVEQQDIADRAREDIVKTVEDINQKVTGWAYGISKYKYDALVKKQEDILKPLDTP